MPDVVVRCRIIQRALCSLCLVLYAPRKLVLLLAPLVPVAVDAPSPLDIGRGLRQSYW